MAATLAFAAIGLNFVVRLRRHIASILRDLIFPARFHGQIAPTLTSAGLITRTPIRRQPRIGLVLTDRPGGQIVPFAAVTIPPVRRARRILAHAAIGLTLAAQSRPGIFRIQPVRPVTELRAAALKLNPPKENGDFRKSDLVELAPLDSAIKLDIRYATGDNFLSTPVYSSARAFLQRPAAEALLRAHRELMKQGYGILVFDAYRPWYVTKIFWDATPPDKHEFVADPSQGSRHNRGCAADISIYDLKTGREVEMTGVYDEMSERSYPNYTGGTAEQRARRDLLRREMEKQGFTVNPSEWWHFDYRDWKNYAIQNVPFEQLANSR